MNITTAEVREALRKDNFAYINSQIAQYITAAKSSLYAAIGEKSGTSGFRVKAEYAQEFESLTNSYIIEYCREYMDQVENDRILTILATQLESFLDPEDTEDG